MLLSLRVVACGLLAAACGVLPNGRRWGEDATLLPGFDRLGKAAKDAALDPWTWVPVGSAAALSIAGLDENIVTWAREHHPLYGSAAHAEDVGHVMRAMAQDAWIASLVATPSGDEPLPWMSAKGQAFLVEWSAVALTDEVTSMLKEAVDRPRPDGSDTNSFPSSGASNTSVMAMLAHRNLDSIDLDQTAHDSMVVGLGLTEAAEAWSRVEAGKHHVTDVLVGTALGNFMGRFIHDAFLGLPDDVRLEGWLLPGDGATLALSFRF
jgi:hypothetical protein